MTPLPRFDPIGTIDQELALRKERLLLARLGGGRLLVAFSGGVDSTYVAWAAHAAAPAGALAVTGLSASVPAHVRAEASRLARGIGIAHETIDTEETEDPRYLENDRDRCYWCKSELYDRLRRLALERGYPRVLDGTNRDDLGDVRPGRRAALERGVESPLADAGLGKAEVRWLSLRAGLPTWDRPASPCLSSRVPFGLRIDGEKLARIDLAEEAVRGLGFREFRVRHLADGARIEVAGEELARALDGEMSERLVAVVEGAGFARAFVDPEPFRSGRLNQEEQRQEEEHHGQVHRV